MIFSMKKRMNMENTDAGDRTRLQSAKLLESIFRAAPVGIGVVCDRVIMLANERLCKIVGYSHGELLNKSSRMLYPTDEEFEHVGIVKYSQIAETGTGTVETRWRRKDGALIDVLLSSSPVVEGDLSAGVTFTALDITDRKKAEQELLNLNETLELRISDRTAVAEQRALQLQRLALELSNAEDREHQRIAMILHDDLQQQLAAIRFGLKSLLPKWLVEGEVAERLAGLETMIDESILKTRNLSYDLSPPTLRQSGLLAALEVLARQTKEKHDLDVLVDASPDSEPRSPVLASVLFRSIRELLFNCKKYSGVKTARIEASRIGNQIEFIVADEGQGFDPTVLEGRNSRDRETGLGLFAIQERINSLSGRIMVVSAPGEGCRISVRLPDSREVEPEKELSFGEGEVRERISAADGATERGKIRLLLADDHAMLRDGLANLFKGEEDLEVAGQAKNGLEAVELANELNPDVVLMDISMPVMNGIEATTKIKQNHPGIRVIGLSMHDDPGTRERMISAGASDYVYKAAPAEELLGAIRTVAGS